MPKEEQEHISVFLPRTQTVEIRKLMQIHEQKTGFKLTMSAALRTLINDGLKSRRVNNESRSAPPRGE